MFDKLRYLRESKKINIDTIRYLRVHINKFIAVNCKRYIDFKIYIPEEDYLKIKYNHHYCYVTIIVKNDNYYWYLERYDKSCFITNADTLGTFDIVANAIRDEN